MPKDILICNTAKKNRLKILKNNQIFNDLIK